MFSDHADKATDLLLKYLGTEIKASRLIDGVKTTVFDDLGIVSPIDKNKTYNSQFIKKNMKAVLVRTKLERGDILTFYGEDWLITSCEIRKESGLNRYEVQKK